MRVPLTCLALALAGVGVAIAQPPADKNAPSEAAQAAPEPAHATLDRTGARCNLTGITSGAAGIDLTMQKLEASTGWLSTVEKIDKGFRVTLNHKTLGYVRLLIVISPDGVCTISPGVSDALPRLERMARIAAGTDDTDDQIAKAKTRLTEISTSIDNETASIKDEQSAIATATIRYTRHRKRTNGPFVYVDDYLLPEGEALVKESNDKIAASNKEIAALTSERGQLQGQVVRLTDGSVGAEVKKLPTSVLAAVNPIVLTFDASSKPNKKATVGTIELMLIAGAEGLKVAATPAARGADAPPAVTAPVKNYGSLADIVKEIPAGVMPRDTSGWTDVKVEVVNDALRKACPGSVLTTTLLIDKESISKLDGKWTMTATPDERIGKQPLRVQCTCPDSLKAQLAMLNVGDRVRITGSITAASIDKDLSNYPLVVMMDHVTELIRDAGGGTPVTMPPTPNPPVTPAPPRKVAPPPKPPTRATTPEEGKRGTSPGELFPGAGRK